MTDAREDVPARPLPEVVTFPALVDIASCDDYAEELEDAFRHTRAAVIADLSATVFCDSSAIRRLVLAEKHAAAAGAELRVVVPSADMRRVLYMSGVGQMLTVYEDMTSALNGALHAGVRADQARAIKLAAQFPAADAPARGACRETGLTGDRAGHDSRCAG